MRPHLVVATTWRVLAQLRRDHRSVAMLLVLPSILIILVRYVFDAEPEVYEHIGAPLLAVFPFFMIFMVASVTTMRERSTGTLERLLTLPIGKLDFLLGYALAFALLAIVQVSLAIGVSTGLLGLHFAGPTWLVIVVAFGNSLLGMSIGLLASAFAQTEFQSVQFMPAVIVPQTLLCGLLTPRESMAAPLHWLSNAFPLSYTIDALNHLTTQSTVSAELVADVVVVVGASFVALALASVTLRRVSN